MATIDHLFFPHIIDIIWLYLDYEGQIAARAACKDWRDRADARLNHIVISCSERPRFPHIFDISTRDLTQPFSSRAWLGSMFHWHNIRDHEWECGCNRRQCPQLVLHESERLAVHLERTGLSTTAAVDLVGFGLDWPRVPPDLSCNSLLRTVLVESDCTIRCYGALPDLSDFKDCCYAYNHDFLDCPPSLVDVCMMTLEPDMPIDTLSSTELSMRVDVQVANYLCLTDPTASYPNLSTVWSEYRDDEVCPVTVIFHNGMPRHDHTPPSKQPDLVAAYADLIHGGNEVIIVGLEEFLDSNDIPEYIETVEREVLRGRRIYDYEEEDDVWWVPEKSCLDNLFFMTHEEYRDHVGEDMYRIHAVR
ncbi:hypothetical protein A1Q2_08459 [Trichosporon asahii var. asahii CBS 8904]|uniref:F-box domain-containing protein n=1 Tax=Trichosporon asahii var. asahii (strain CBS 8904) TaxID=1220162 RepID=K1VDZ0_TRIAC|nr:hypothetical protein A1Q2_08459 [Trichosporon asahii var. asahii CBS 8904]